MMKKLLLITILIFSLLVCAVSAADLAGKVDLKSGMTETTKTSVNITDSKVTFADKATGISVATDTKIDGVLVKATDIKIDEQGAYTFTSDKTALVTFKYEYINDKLKETIILKEDTQLTFPVILQPFTKIIEYGQNFKIVSSYGDESKGLISETPFGIDAAGHTILMKYTLVNNELILEYNRDIFIYNETLTYERNITEIISYIEKDNKTGNNIKLLNIYRTPQYDKFQIQYPLTIDPVWGTFGVTSFTSNVTSSNIVPFTVQFNDTSTSTPTGWAWFFGDENYTQVAWVLQNTSSGWQPRYYHSTVAQADGSIILTGGVGTSSYNDTWRSTDNGATWTLMSASSSWQPRYGHSVAVDIGDYMVLTGGLSGTVYKNDTWFSNSDGAGWTMWVTGGWQPRLGHSTVAMPDDSIILTGGTYGGSGNRYNDTWRGTLHGSTWTLMNASSGWSAREFHSTALMSDGSII